MIQHSEEVPLDLFERWLDVEVVTVRPFAGDPVPAVDACGDGLIVLGGLMSAYDDGAAPWLEDTRSLLLGAVETGLPSLAICLGAQLLAVAGGGIVAVNAPPGREAGVIDVFWRPSALDDEVLGQVAEQAVQLKSAARTLRASPLPSMHADAVVDLPPGAEWLASSVMYPYHAFRWGSVLSLQFHPEASRETLVAWARTCPDVDADAVARDYAVSAEQIQRSGRLIAEGFSAQVTARRLLASSS